MSAPFFGTYLSESVIVLMSHYREMNLFLT